MPFFGTSEVIKTAKASKPRKDAAALRLQYYRDRQHDDLLELLRKDWDQAEKFRRFSLNIVKKITNARAMVYKTKPFREFDGWDQDAGQALYDDFNANVILKKANRYTKLLKTVLLQVGWNGERPTVNLVTGNILDVDTDGDPERLTRIIVTHPAKDEKDVRYSVWTLETFERLDFAGNRLINPENRGNINPYGVLPFLPLFDYAPDDAFWLDGGEDIIEAQRAINVGFVNLWRAIEYASHGQAWTAGANIGDVWKLKTGPSVVLNLPKDAKLAFARPETPIVEVLTAIEFVIKQTAVANDLAANVFELDPKAESGAAKLAESRDLIEARADDLELWRRYEGKLFDVLKVVANTHAPGSIPEAATSRVDFGEVDQNPDERARLEAFQRRLDMGVWSPVDVLMADNPDIRTRDDAIQILQDRQEEAALLGAAFAGPSFSEVNR